MTTHSAPLFALCDRCFGAKPGRFGLIALSEAEVGLSSGLLYWQQRNEALKEKLVEGATMSATPPPGYDVQKVNQTSKDELHLAEWTLSALLNNCYEVQERIINATVMLHEESSGALFQDIAPCITPDASAINGRKIDYEKIKNVLVGARIGTSTHQSVLAIKQHLKNMMKWRGDRMHSLHFYAYGIEENGVASVMYANEEPHSSIPATVTFSDADLKKIVVSYRPFMQWWISSLKGELTALTANVKTNPKRAER